MSEPDSTTSEDQQNNPTQAPNQEQNQNQDTETEQPEEEKRPTLPSFVDELGVEDIEEPVAGSRGKLFSVAGRNSPVAEFTDEFLVLHPPQLPYVDDQPDSEVIVINMDDTGVLVNELGQRKKIPGARFEGRELFYYWEQKPGTMKHYAVFFDDEGKHHFLVIEGEKLTTNVIYQLRNMTHDGELAKFTEISVD